MAKTTRSKLKTALGERSRRRREVLAERQVARRSTAKRRNDLTPDLHLVKRPLASLQTGNRRLRKRERPHVDSVKRAMMAHGQCVPILITEVGEVIDGETRLQAAAELGLESLWCIVIDHLTDEEVRLLRLQTNRLQEAGEWDLEALRLEFVELLELDLPLETTGFTLPEIDQLLLSEPQDDEESKELEPDEGTEPVCRLGDIWALGDHLIACGDSRDPAVIEALFGDGSLAALIFTDPPYNVPIKGHVTTGKHPEFAMASGEMTREEFSSFINAFMAATLPRLRDGGLLALFMDWRSVALTIGVGEALGLTLLNLVVWAKTNGGMGSLWRSQHELIPVLKKGSAPHVNNVSLGKHGRWRSNLWTYPGASSLGSDARDGLDDHPTVKPVAMLVDALLDVTDIGDLVIDPFLGSGSTLIAAEKTGRKCRAVEIDPAYVDVAIRRWIRETGKEPELVAQVYGANTAPLALLPAPNNQQEGAR